MRKLLIVLAVLVVVLGGVVVVVDRVAAGAAEREIADVIRAESELEREPEVSIRGFPFLTQAIGGRYKAIDVSIGQITVDEVRVDDVDVRFEDVDAPLSDLLDGDTSGVTARRATASGLLSFAVLNERAPDGTELRADGERLRVDGDLTLAGVSVPVRGYMAVSPGKRGVAVRAEKVEVARVPVPRQLVSQRLSFTVPVRQLPGDSLEDVTVQRDGIRFTASQQDVRFSRLAGAGNG